MEKFLLGTLFVILSLVFLGLTFGLGSMLADLATCITCTSKRPKH